MSLPIAQVKSGMVIVVNGKPFFVLDSSHVKLGRGRGIQRVRVKSIVDGSVREETFRGNESIEEADVESRQAQYLYGDSTSAHFMNPDFNEILVPLPLIGERTNFLKAGEHYTLKYFNGEPIAIDLPIKVSLLVAETDPGLRGDRASAGTKPATLETGYVVQVPLHIKIGDQIVIDTRAGSYVERAKF